MKFIALIIVAIAIAATTVSSKPVAKTDVELKNFFTDLFNQVLFPAVETQVQNVALLGAQLLAGLSQTGLAGLGVNIPREVDDKIKGFFNDLFWVFMEPTDYLVQTLSLLGAQVLAGISVTGLSGKRELNAEELKGFFNDLFWVIMEPTDYLVQTLSLLGAQVLAGISVTGLSGKRDVEVDKGVTDFFSTVLTGAVQANIDDINNLVQNWASLGANLLAGLSLVGLSGIGKRELSAEELKGFFNDLFWVFMEPTDYLVQTLSLLGAQVLAGISVTGLSGK